MTRPPDTLEEPGHERHPRLPTPATPGAVVSDRPATVLTGFWVTGIRRDGTPGRSYMVLTPAAAEQLARVLRWTDTRIVKRILSASGTILTESTPAAATDCQ